MKTILALAAMLLVAPLVAATVLVCWQPDRWGGTINPLAIAAIAFFGLLSVPLWTTYIPALIITPLVMKRLAARRAFTQMPLPALAVLSLVVGALAGSCVILPVVMIAAKDPTASDLVLNWLAAGAASGAVTLSLIFMIYRLLDTQPERVTAPNGGPATPPPIPTVSEGHHR